MQYPESELILDQNQHIYHLGVSKEQMATTIILVGDQARVSLVSQHFDHVRHRSQRREFVVHTGTYNGKEISVVSTGIGTDNIDIVINEIDALFNIDLKNRCDQQEHTKLDFVRIGTCGILQPHIPIHSFLLSQKALGFDNVAHFYQIDFSENELKLKDEMVKHMQLPTTIQPYLTEASTELINRLSSDQTFSGLTVTSSGFYGPQGRQLRIPTHTKELNSKLESFQSPDNETIINFEMETSAIYALGKALGHECLTLCLGIANRARKEFSDNYPPHMDRLIKYVLERI